MIDYPTWRALLANEPLPAAICDLDAVDRNEDLLVARLPDRPITLRIASKSIRVPWLMRHLIEHSERLAGLMTFSAHETALLADQGFDDLLLAYPASRPDEATALAKAVAGGATLHVAVDSPEHVDLLNAAAAEHGVTLGACIDIDVSWRPLAGRLHFGVRRSPIRDARAAESLAARIAGATHLELTALLAYEAQVAGMRDTNPGSRHLDPIRRAIKRRSEPLAATRRAEILDAVRAAGHSPTVVNGGGTGSISSTGADPSVTEVTAGSGFLCPHLFDGYTGLPLEPAAFFAIAVARRSDPDHVTCAGGGYIASGAAGPDRLPIVHLPAGLSPLPLEGFGEVQTPFHLGPSAPRLGLGDPILCRHAKGGELAGRFRELLIVRDGRIVHRAPTYRGLDRCFF